MRNLGNWQLIIADCASHTNEAVIDSWRLPDQAIKPVRNKLWLRFEAIIKTRFYTECTFQWLGLLIAWGENARECDRSWDILLLPNIFTPRVSDEIPDVNFVDQAILQALTFLSFASVHQISRMILFSKSMIYRHLTESLGYISKRLRWVPHRLSDIEKSMIEKSKELLQLLLSIKH
jgi:hypothetical protein